MPRNAVFAGQFYTSNIPALEREINSYLNPKAEKIDALGCVSPHAGYMYSGSVAGSVLSSIKPKKTYIILGPNHTGYGKPFSVDIKGYWITPLGKVEINDELAKIILDKTQFFEYDSSSHAYEHSIEVQLPFLQMLNKDFQFVPIMIAQAGDDDYIKMGKEIANAAELSGKKDITIIASSDMTHYESRESAEKKDSLAIDKILRLDIKGFLATIRKYDISMCGYGPSAIMMSAAISLGAKHGELIKYNTSGDASGDYSSVVGYAGIVVC